MSDIKEDVAAHATSGFQFFEEITPHVTMTMALKKIMVSAKSKFQTMQIIETNEFGKTLVLDCKTQSAQRDEKIYHESLVHPTMLAHPNPKTVFIGGGGEMATAREVLRHKSVEKVVMCDIDEKVVKFCLEELPEWNDGAFSDKRLTVVYDDANAYLNQFTDFKFDVIIMDIADPIEAGPGIVCYYDTFYKMALTKMNPDGIFVTQGGPCGHITYTECFTSIFHTFRQVFKHVHGARSEIPSFGSPWGFVVGHNSDDVQARLSNDQSADKIDKAIESRIVDLDSKPLQYYDGTTHKHMFSLPKYVRQGLAQETRVINKDNPVYMY